MRHVETGMRKVEAVRGIGESPSGEKSIRVTNQPKGSLVESFVSKETCREAVGTSQKGFVTTDSSLDRDEYNNTRERNLDGNEEE